MTTKEREYVAAEGPNRRRVRSLVGRGVVLATWLTLTILFAGGGVVIVGAALTVLGPLTGAPATLALVGAVLGTLALAPTLARVVTGAAVDRVDDALGRGAPAGDRTLDDSRAVYCVRDERGRCRPPCPCGT